MMSLMHMKHDTCHVIKDEDQDVAWLHGPVLKVKG
jgi:hypothetical protein